MIHDPVAAFAARNDPTPPHRLGQRYSATRFLPEAGNTVLCHLDHDDPGHRPVIEIRKSLQALPGADCFLFTPAASLHMTLLDGISETRRTADVWPEGLDRDAEMGQVTAMLEERLAGFTPLPAFRVGIVSVGPGWLSLAGATPEDETAMRWWRDALTVPFGFRHAGHDAYRFHMTLAYPVKWLPDALVPVWSEALREMTAALRQAVPVLPLTAPAFCSFEDMRHFEERLVLGR
jgi:hypothetical protein